MATKVVMKNKRQMILLGALIVVFGYYILHTFVFTGSGSKGKGKAQDQIRVTPSPKPGAGEPVKISRQTDNAARSQQERLELVLDDKTPLKFELLAVASPDQKLGKRGNIFDYYQEPPLQKEPDPLPPPITISYLQPQTAVAGTPRAFTLTVSGRAFPNDAQILIDGRPKPTKRMNDTVLTTEVSANEYGSPRNLNIEVKSQSDAKLFSNPMSFVVQAAPEPPFKYVGRIGEIGILEMNNTKEVVRLTRGGTVQGVWRIESISDSGIEVQHMQYNIKKRIVMQDRGR